MKLDWEWAYGPAVIKEGQIRLQKVGGYYHPFHLYYPAAEDRSLYLRFADIDINDDDAILAFVSRYGVLDTNFRDDALEILRYHDIRTDAYVRLNAHTLMRGFALGQQFQSADGKLLPKDMKQVHAARSIVEWPDTAWSRYYDEKGLPVLWGSEKVVLSPIGAGHVRHRNGDSQEDFDTIDAFADEVYYFKALLFLWAESRKPDMDRLGVADVVSELQATEYAEEHFTSVLQEERDKVIARATKKLLALSLDELRAAASGTMATFIELQLTGQVSFTIRNEAGKFVQEWHPHTLLAAMYLMLSLDLSGSLPARKCVNEKCGRLFIPTRESMVYCAETCQTQDRVRRWRQRQKQGGDSE